MATQTLTSVNPTKKAGSAAGSFKKLVGNRIGSAVALVIAVLWTVPTFGLFVSSFRPESEIKSSGWWSIFTDPQFTLDNYQQVLQGSTSTNLAVF